MDLRFVQKCMSIFETKEEKFDKVMHSAVTIIYKDIIKLSHSSLLTYNVIKALIIITNVLI